MTSQQVYQEETPFWSRTLWGIAYWVIGIIILLLLVYYFGFRDRNLFDTDKGRTMTFRERIVIPEFSPVTPGITGVTEF